MFLSEVSSDGTQICDGYWLKVAPGEYLKVEVPLLFDKAKSLNYPNIAAQYPKLYDFKHYSRGRKWWTQRAGISLLFILRKDQIEVLPENGYSYPKVKIAGEAITFSCSGGTNGNGWCDWLSDTGHCCVNLPVKVIKLIASVAVDPKQAGVEVKIRRLSPQQAQQWQGLVWAAQASKFVQVGQALHLREGCYWASGGGGSSEPIRFTKRRGLSYLGTVADRTGLFGAGHKDIDWHKTGIANNWSALAVEPFNYAGPILPSHQEEEDQWHADHKGQLMTVAAWGSGNDNDDIAEGFVGVAAAVNGNRGNHREARYFIVPEAEYHARENNPTGSIVVDPARHPAWAGPKSGRVTKEAVLL